MPRAAPSPDSMIIFAPFLTSLSTFCGSTATRISDEASFGIIIFIVYSSLILECNKFVKNRPKIYCFIYRTTMNPIFTGDRLEQMKVDDERAYLYCRRKPKLDYFVLQSLTSSNTAIPYATATFSDCLMPNIGISIAKSQSSITSFATPLISLPMIRQSGKSVVLISL